MVPFAQSLVQVLLLFRGGKGIGFIQVRKNLDGILTGTKVGKDPMERLLHVQRLYLYLITVESHEVRLDTKGTGLIQTSAT